MHINISGKMGDLSGSTKGIGLATGAAPQADILIDTLGLYAPQDFFETTDETWTAISRRTPFAERDCRTRV